MRSWRKTVNILLVVIIVLATGILVWTNLNYNMQMRETFIKENADAVRLWTQYVDTSFDSAYGHVYELATEIYNKTELRSGSPSMRMMARHEIATTMSDKLLASANIDCFFVLDTDTDDLLYASNTLLTTANSRMLKGIVREAAAGCATRITDKSWALWYAGDKLCFVKAVSIGKYRVGALCRAENFEITNIVPVLGEEVSLLLLSDGEVCFVGGEVDRSGELVLDRNREPHIGNLVVFSCPLERVNATAVLAAKIEGIFFGVSPLVPVVLVTVSAVFLALMFIFNRLMRTKIVRPTQELLDATHEISSGNLRYRIGAEPGSEEFEKLFASFNNMAEQIHHLRIESYDQLLEDRENKLRLLRAQIKPHFYLNAITTISNMTYQGKNEDIREFCLTLARYMRYMLNVQGDWTTVDEELAHIRNYMKIQRFRSAGTLTLEIDCPAEVGRARIPLLVMFTMVENTFKHAMSLNDQLTVRIRGRRVEEPDFSGYSVIIEDDGDGFPENILETMNAPVEAALPAKEHLGLSNVRYTMALLFGRQGLLRLSNSEGGGARVEIRIPDGAEGEKHETPHM